MKNTFFSIVVFFSSLPFSQAKILYVNGASGNDSVTYESNSQSNPWRSIGRAAWGTVTRPTLYPAVSSGNPTLVLEAARAGDTVMISSGTYSTVGTGGRHEVAYNPINSGQLGNPIIFQAQGSVILSYSSGAGPMIGSAYGRNYITWRGFTINEATARSVADTGPVVVAGSTGVSIEDCDIDGNGDPGYGDNHAGIRVDHSQRVRIVNNRIRNFRTSGVNLVNGAAIQTYESKGFVIEHNEIYNSGSGIFFKQIGCDYDSAGRRGPVYLDSSGNIVPFINAYSDMDDIIRYNLIYDSNYGIVQHRHFHTSSSIYFLVYQNIIRNCGSGITMWAFTYMINGIAVGDGPSNGRFINNTIENCSNGIYIKAGDLRSDANQLVQNNLITNSTSYVIANEGASGLNFLSGKLILDRNWYYNNSNFLSDNYVNRSFSSYRTSYPNQDVNSSNAVIQTSSSAQTSGRAIHGIGGSNGTPIPVGAYITGLEVIGRTTLLSNILIPRAPSGLRILQ